MSNYCALTVEVYGLPVIDFGEVNDTLRVSLPHTLGAGQGFNSYLWNDGATTQTYQVSTPGNYFVTVTDNNGCEGINSVYVDFPSSIKKIYGSNSRINIYPNPTNHQISIFYEAEKNENFIIEIINIQNQLVFVDNIKGKSNWKKIIDITDWAKGIYYLRVRTRDTFIVKKVIIQ